MKNIMRFITMLAVTAMVAFNGGDSTGAFERNSTPARDTSSSVTAQSLSGLAVIDLGLAAVGAQAQVTPDEHYHRVWEIVRDNFLYQDRLKNFAAWEHKYDGKLKTQADAEKAINEMLDSLADGYTYFRNQAATTTKAQQTASTNVVSYRMLAGDVGYVRITTFGSTNAKSETEAALRALGKSGAKAYIVDLRDNGGGYINQAFGIFAMFVDQGTFATIKGTKDGKPYLEVQTVTAKNLVDDENGTKTVSGRVENLTGNKPVVLLVNGSSASASEMLAGALRDNGRAVIVGTQTYGKGIAQLNIDLAHNTSMQVTFARLNQPKGGNIHGKGMTPDHVLANRPRMDDQLAKALQVAQDKVSNP